MTGLGLRPYARYRESGVEWLGRVPEHWGVAPLKREFNVVGGSTPASGIAAYWDGDIPWVSPSDLDGDLSVAIETTARQITAEGLASCSSSLVPPGSIVLSTRAPIGSVGLTGTELCTNQGCKSLVARALAEARYFAQVMLSAAPELNARGKGTTFLELSGDALAAFPVPVPPPDEQAQIARFLDRETAKIDALVAEQERLIELLKEKRQAVISHAVTRGLNPDAPMKDSGVEWLGEVPAHWDCVHLGRVCRKVADGPHFSPTYVDDGVPFLSARNIRVNGWDLSDVKFVSEHDCAEFDRRVVPERGDVLYTKGGTTGIARAVDLTERFQVWVHVAVLKLKREMAAAPYIAAALNSSGSYEQSQLLTRGATNQDLGLTRMIRIWLPLPPLPEQQAIVAHLDTATTRLDTLTTEATRAIALLQERRTALISAAVTGQIDVRPAPPSA